MNDQLREQISDIVDNYARWCVEVTSRTASGPDIVSDSELVAQHRLLLQQSADQLLELFEKSQPKLKTCCNEHDITCHNRVLPPEVYVPIIEDEQ